MCLHNSVSLALVCHCGGGCHHVPLTASKAGYKHITVEEFPAACCQAAGPLGPVMFRPRTVRFLHSEVVQASRASRRTRQPWSGASDLCPHTSYTRNPMSPYVSALSWVLSEEAGLPGTELGLCSVLGTPWFCPLADSTRCPPLNWCQPLVNEIFIPGRLETWDTQPKAISPGRPCGFSNCLSLPLSTHTDL